MEYRDFPAMSTPDTATDLYHETKKALQDMGKYTRSRHLEVYIETCKQRGITPISPPDDVTV